MIAEIAPPVWHWLIVAGSMAVIARLFTFVAGRLVGPGLGTTAAACRGIEVVFVVTSVALWWWETCHRGALSAPLVGDHRADQMLGARYVAHVVLFTLLAAATWIDFRHRVIPDGITIPGVLLGLMATTLDPATLLPVGREMIRSYAAPLIAPDLLGAFGPLHGSPPPAWLGPWPVGTGLAAALAVFALWWWVCTGPADATDDATDADRIPFDPRWLVFACGFALIGTAWWRGGDHWLGLLASLAGMLAGAGLVWLTREGASRALGQEAMGLGDVTLMAMVGAWLGWQACVLTCFLAVFIGLAHGLLQVILRRENELPFGPSLCLAAVVVVVAWRSIWERTAATFERPGELALVAAAVVVLTAASLFVLRRIRGG
jgi:prepilin signal peptidase PulO-like enzyme (type II secretory pathway)